jgi:hypothetical protein
MLFETCVLFSGMRRPYELETSRSKDKVVVANAETPECAIFNISTIAINGNLYVLQCANFMRTAVYFESTSFSGRSTC